MKNARSQLCHPQATLEAAARAVPWAPGINMIILGAIILVQCRYKVNIITLMGLDVDMVTLKGCWASAGS